ncbi:long-chain fatty-acid--CoA ligase [Corynebacterium epidermidicanis]|uniref:Acyl-CoA synthetase (AMP-forming)/AMP-acid ligase II n=1 Tax=Corynebacterium epidermidicanis TaxID=1050174 RepID=A0A0G3GTJ9_9CORY|nr:long-chain fatty-acid--CoA ligase [Corynebacterium epidermidicanis]AKK02878.1 acyl-CoA synthetase (AMP-forming)/AMP-acid ligase II [Corynebacterium epidermidicanis]
MLTTMSDHPLLVKRILEYASTVHAATKITTWTSSGPEETSFSAIGHRAAAFAHALHDTLGIDDDQRVGTLMNNCAEHVETMFATMCKGAVFTPLNKQLMGDQIQHIINHAQIEVIVVDPKIADKLWPILPNCPSVRALVFIGTGSLPDVATQLPPHISLHSFEALLDARPSRYDWPELDEHTAAAICYSTGTTGAPKGVAYSHRSIYLHSMSLRTSDSMGVHHGDPFLCCVPIYHVLSWGVPIAAFMSGAPLIFPGSHNASSELAEIIAETHPRVAHGVPTIWISLMVHYLHNPPARMSLTEIFVGGSPVPPVLIKLWEERYGVDIVHVWGMTETSTVATVARPPKGVSGEQRWRYRVSQGRFPASVEYRVVNDGKVMSSSDRNQGEIQVRGPWVTASYLHSPAEDGDGPAAVFRDAAVEDAPEQFTSDGWLRTGDVGSVTNDGFLTVEDRARDVIRSGGEWIYSVQLENMVMEHKDVVEAAVIGYPDEKWGERPLAVTVLHKDVPANRETAEALRDSLRERLPRWMLPEYWAFVSFIDKTSVGKFDKKDLRMHLADGEYQVIKLRGPGEAKPVANS